MSNDYTVKPVKVTGDYKVTSIKKREPLRGLVVKDGPILIGYYLDENGFIREFNPRLKEDPIIDILEDRLIKFHLNEVDETGLAREPNGNGRYLLSYFNVDSQEEHENVVINILSLLNGSYH